MARKLLFLLGALALATGVYIILAPQAFYDAVPGLDLMGPFSIHFIRDVGLAYLAAAGAMLWGAWKRIRSVALAGATWPLLHALFHIQIWVGRGFPFDTIALSDFLGVIVPGFLGVWAAWAVEAGD